MQKGENSIIEARILYHSNSHGRPQKFFQGGTKSIFCLSFSGCWRCNAKWTYTKKKMFNVTATVTYIVFLVRKLCSEQLFVSLSMDFLRLS